MDEVAPILVSQGIQEKYDKNKPQTERSGPYYYWQES
jgi:hypothetical protein